MGAGQRPDTRILREECMAGPVARGPCDSGESGPGRGFLLKPGLLSHLQSALGHRLSPSPKARHGPSLRLSSFKTGELLMGGFIEQMGVKTNSSFTEFSVRHSSCQCCAMWSCPSTLDSLICSQECRLGSRFCQEGVQASKGPENWHDHRWGGL